jgi:putative chitinase
MTLDKASFYTHVRTKLGRLSALQVEGFEAVLAAIDDAPLSHQAYMMATT